MAVEKYDLGFIFDLDDTLIPTQHKYKLAELAFIGRVVERAHSVDDGFASYKILERTVKRMGYEAEELAKILGEYSRAVARAKSEDDIVGRVVGLFEEYCNKYNDKCPASDLDFVFRVSKKHAKKLRAGFRELKGISEDFLEVDKANVELFSRLEEYDFNGFHTDRFPTSMVQVFKQYCSEAGVDVEESEVQDVWDIGKGVFVIKKEFLKGVIETLNFIKPRIRRMSIVTKGEEEKQMEKVEVNNLFRWFSDDEIYVVPGKDEALFREVAGKVPELKYYAVGNALGSDVAPALRAGLEGILISRDTWSLEGAKDGRVRFKAGEHYLVFDSFIEIKRRWDEVLKWGRKS